MEKSGWHSHAHFHDLLQRNIVDPGCSSCCMMTRGGGGGATEVHNYTFAGHVSGAFLVGLLVRNFTWQLASCIMMSWSQA